MLAPTFNSSTQADLRALEISLVFVTSSRPARAAQRNSAGAAKGEADTDLHSLCAWRWSQGTRSPSCHKRATVYREGPSLNTPTWIGSGIFMG